MLTENRVEFKGWNTAQQQNAGLACVWPLGSGLITVEREKGVWIRLAWLLFQFSGCLDSAQPYRQ